MPPIVIAGLEGRFRLHHLANAGDPDAFLAEVGPRIRGLAAGVVAPVKAELIDRLPRLEIIAKYGVGYDTVDAEHAARRGVIVTNTPDVLTEETADTAFGLLLMTVRELAAAAQYARERRWAREGPYRLTQATLRDRTVGIVGLGRIGEAIARRLDASRVPVVYHNRRPKPGVPWRYYPGLLEMARDVDTLINVLPGSKNTEKMIDAAVLEALGPRGIFINIGRGTSVDEEALIAALRNRGIHAAGLDVFWNEPNIDERFFTLDNVVLLPHVGSASIYTRDAMGQLVVDNLVSWFTDGRPLTPVAETPWPA
jgi:lactate dehydrogenase-like 2-hydroxyacid dehydrogenase